jgi:hypothetical protein
MLLRSVLPWLALPLAACADDAVEVALPECPARLERRAAEPDALRARTPCPLSPSSAAALLAQGLARMFPGQAPPVRSIFLGRLLDYPEWSERLALAAARSRQWDSRRGRPRPPGSSANATVARLLNGPAYPVELRPVFAPYGLTACLGGVEKVLALPAKAAIRREAREPAGLAESALLPADAMVWLRLQPESLPCGESRGK